LLTLSLTIADIVFESSMSIGSPCVCLGFRWRTRHKLIRVIRCSCPPSSLLRWRTCLTSPPLITPSDVLTASRRPNRDWT
jgi:hypothetical protein